jgi:hypothetical protein
MLTAPPLANGWFVGSLINHSGFIGGREVDGIAVIYHVVGDQEVDITAQPRVRQLPTQDNIQRILEELENLIDVPLPSYGHERVMYVGMPQSGKSLVQFILLWQSCFVHEKGTVHLLMNRIDSLLQNISRDYLDLCEKIKNICERLDIPDYENYIFHYVPFPAYAQTDSDADSMYTVYVAMANVKQLQRVKELNPVNRQTIVFDEADIFIQKEDKPVMTLIQEVCNEAYRRYECTATPFSNFNEAGQVYDSVISIPPKNEYRGFRSPKIHRHIINDEEKIEDILEQLFSKDTGTFKNVTLVNVDSHIESQEKVAQFIDDYFNHQVTVHVMNSRSSSYERPLSHLMNQIANSEDTKPVVIVAGMMASRAVTFRTSKENPKQAFLTGMVYAPAKHANQTTLMQAMRVFGNYDPLFPDIHVYWTREVDDAIQASFRNNMALTKGISTRTESRKCLETVPVKVVPGRKFSSSDDSKFERLDKIEFGTIRKLIRFVTNEFNRYRFSDAVITSESLRHVPIQQGTTRSEITRTLRDTLRQGRQGHLHAAWSDVRYEQLFSIKNRLTHGHYMKTAFTCGNGDFTGTSVPCVTWKREYEDVRTWNDPATIYMFRTTKGNWKAWLPQQMDRFRKIVHG